MTSLADAQNRLRTRTPHSPHYVELFLCRSIHPHALRAPDFNVPDKLETHAFRIRKLTVSDVAKDDDTVMTSVERLKTMSPGCSSPDGLALEAH